VQASTKLSQVTVGVRPEDLTVSPTGQGLEVQVDLVEELGADGYLYGHADVKGNRVDVVARVDGRAHPNAGETVFITPEPKHIHAFDLESGERLTKPITV
jgi:multiple sugar transport system ATP-binding protein